MRWTRFSAMRSFAVPSVPLIPSFLVPSLFTTPFLRNSLFPSSFLLQSPSHPLFLHPRIADGLSFPLTADSPYRFSYISCLSVRLLALIIDLAAMTVDLTNFSQPLSLVGNEACHRVVKKTATRHDDRVSRESNL